MPPSLRPLLSSLLDLRARARERQSPGQLQENKSLAVRLAGVFLRTWDLGFTAFGGPAVHFQILHHRFVTGKGGEVWCDEQTYQELFAICQATPGPGSTKMIFCLALLHGGFIPALFVFLLWSLPGAIGMYALSLGAERIDQSLPGPVYALLSGLNAATVGIIALAAVQLAEKAIKDRLSRILIILGACAGLCYNALWYFPVLMALGGLTAVIWDGWLAQRVGKLRAKWKRRRENPQRMAEESAAGLNAAGVTIPPEDTRPDASGVQKRNSVRETQQPDLPAAVTQEEAQARESTAGQAVQLPNHKIKVRVGIGIAALFFISLIVILVLRGVIRSHPRALNLFANMYLAGTVIFGGGPVVIPLLRSYVVDPGWVSSRNFLLGLAIIQAFPGPNFNFGVYLGALALQNSEFPTVFGAFLGFIGIFAPGIVLAVAIQSFWYVLRRRKWIVDLLRGVNATAIGLVFTAVYRLWEIGYLTPETSSGQSLGLEPWWVVVATVTYSATAWFKVPAAPAIVFGAVLGLIWYGAVQKDRAAWATRAS